VDSGFYAASAGLRAQSQALEVVAHNLANLNTAGFRGQQTTFQSLVAMSRPGVSNVLNNALNSAANNFGVLEGTHLDMTAGSLEATGNPLDVGIEGSGFFAIQTAGGVRYTRNGNFHTDAAGNLLTATGGAVMGTLGPVQLPGGDITISSDGTISQGGAAVATLKLATFKPGTSLKLDDVR